MYNVSHSRHDNLLLEAILFFFKELKLLKISWLKVELQYSSTYGNLGTKIIV